MPTVIDSLLVTLGLKADDFHKEKKKVESGLEELTKSAAKFLAVIGGSYEIKRFVQNQIEANSALDRFSKNLNENAESIQNWSNAAELAGGSAQGMQGTLMMLSRAQTDLQLTGQSTLVPYLSALGVSLSDVRGHALPVIDVLEKIGDNLMAKNHGDRRSAFNMGQMMNIDAGTLNVILQGREALEDFMKRMGELNKNINVQTAEASKLRTQLFWVNQTFLSLGRDILQDASPALEKIFQGFQEFADWCRANKQLLEDFFTIIAVGIAAVSIAALPITLTVAAFVALAAAMALVWQDYQTWKNGGESIFGSWAPAIKVATIALEELKSELLGAFYRAAHLGAAMMALKDGNYAIAAEAFSDAVHGKPVDSNNDSNRDRFINAASDQLGVPVSAIDAQLRLETGPLGDKTIGTFNYGNMKGGKGYRGSIIPKDVTEYNADGSTRTEHSTFRDYSTPEQAAADYAAVIKTKFPGAVGAKTAAAFATGLQAGGYATDPNYVSKIAAIANGIPGASAAASGVANGATSSTVTNNAGPRVTTVNVGDVTINSQATDGQGIAKDFSQSFKYFATAQANVGLH